MRKTVVMIIGIMFFSRIVIASENDNQQKNIDGTDSQKQVVLSNTALKKLVAYGQPNTDQIKKMLAQHDFASLEKIYDGIFELYKNDVQYEAFLENAYAVFTPKNASIDDLHLWVGRTGSYMAYAARGVYLTNAGQWARGGKYINETSQSQMDNMRQLHEDAIKDLRMAISKNPTFMPAYRYLIRIAMMSTVKLTAREILKKAEEQDKRTYYVRYEYMLSLL